eukprot:gene6232-6948_t
MAALVENFNPKMPELYCICKKAYSSEEFMIECDKCKDWFHGSCVKINEFAAQDIDVYHCPSCQILHGPLVLKKRRNAQRLNYRDLNEGIKPILAGTMDFIKQLKDRQFMDMKSTVISLENGYSITSEYLEKNGFNKPILVKKAEGLGLALPPSNFSVFDVEQHVGSLHEVHVIDVAKQEDLRMKMREWTEYYNCPVRTKVFNVISLEFSKTDLAKLVSPPAVVREITWVENVWPKVLPEDSIHAMPLVQKYCLMGVKDCYTDFHVDFGGTSVWYHVFRGEKIFYLIEPSDENLKKYEAWVSSADQSQVFFGDRVAKCVKCCVKQGQTLFIPSGWVHAVMTPVDTLVFGGNFLSSLNIGLQLKLYDLENRLDTPLKFRFPNFETTAWYAARSILRKMRDLHMEGVKIPAFLYKGIYDLVRYLKFWTSNKETFVKFHKYQIPIEVNYVKLIRSLEKELKKDMKMTPMRTTSMVAVPSIVMTEMPKPGAKPNSGIKGSKTVIKLKLTGPNPNLGADATGRRKLKKVKKGSGVSSGGRLSIDEKRLKKKRDKKKKETGRLKDKETGNPDESKARFQARNEMMFGPGSLKRGTEFKPPVDNKPKELAQEDPLKLKLTFNHSEFAHLEDQDLEAAQLLSQLPGMDARNLSHSGNVFNMSSSSHSHTSQDRPVQPVAGGPIKTSTTGDVMEQIEAAKNDLFVRGGERSAIFFNNQNSNWNPAKVKQDSNLDDEYRITEPLPKPKGSIKRRRSESDSDYDPSEEYYQDANFVYPRLTSTSDYEDEDDFSWNPGQRTKKKPKKTLNPQSKLNSHLPEGRKPKNAGDSSNKSNWKLDLQEFSEHPPHGSNLQTKQGSSNQSTKPDQQQQQLLEKKKDRVKKGNSTAKQRLGKLLKLDKLGGRYVR